VSKTCSAVQQEHIIIGVDPGGTTGVSAIHINPSDPIPKHIVEQTIPLTESNDIITKRNNLGYYLNDLLVQVMEYRSRLQAENPAISYYVSVAIEDVVKTGRLNRDKFIQIREFGQVLGILYQWQQSGSFNCIRIQSPQILSATKNLYQSRISPDQQWKPTSQHIWDAFLHAYFCYFTTDIQTLNGCPMNEAFGSL